MLNYFLVAAFLLSLLLVAGIVRVLRGPGDADRMMAAQLFGTQATAILLLLAGAYSSNTIIDIALVFSLLAVVATVAFIHRPPTNEIPNDVD